MTEPVEVDAFHQAVLEDVRAADRARIAAGEREFVRLMVPHELCAWPRCDWWPATTVVVVTSLGPELRVRRPIATDWAAA